MYTKTNKLQQNYFWLVRTLHDCMSMHIYMMRFKTMSVVTWMKFIMSHQKIHCISSTYNLHNNLHTFSILHINYVITVVSTSFLWVYPIRWLITSLWSRMLPFKCWLMSWGPKFLLHLCQDILHSPNLDVGKDEIYK